MKAAKLRIMLSVLVIACLLPQVAHSDTQVGDGHASFASVVKKVIPSVVNISTITTLKVFPRWGTPEDVLRDLYQQFFGPRPRENFYPKAISLGSGFVIDQSGIILTNNHVVMGADEILINFTEAVEERPSEASVIGRDPELDIALIRVKTKRDVVPLHLGDSNQSQVGDYVIAIGNPFGQGHSVTHGIISATGRIAPNFPLATYLQTDTPINPGNSGGPLVNMDGEVVGVNNAIDIRAQGIGYAIPINDVKQILPQLRSRGFVSRGYIGIVVEDITPEIAEKLQIPQVTRAPIVTGLAPGDPADRAGIKLHDVILEVNGATVHSASDLIMAITAMPIGTVAEITVSRGKKQVHIPVEVMKRPNLAPVSRGS